MDKELSKQSEARIGESSWLIARESWLLLNINSRNIVKLLLNLPMLVGEDKILHIEGHGPHHHPILALMDSRKPENVTEFEDGEISSVSCQVDPDTGNWQILDRCPCYMHNHMPITQENMNALAKLSREYYFFGAAMHFHVYKGMDLILEAWDKADEGCYVTTDIAEDTIKEFCKAVGCQYGRVVKHETRGSGIVQTSSEIPSRYVRVYSDEEVPIDYEPPTDEEPSVQITGWFEHSDWLIFRNSWLLLDVDDSNIIQLLLNLPMIVGEDAILHLDGAEHPRHPILDLVDSRRPEKITLFDPDIRNITWLDPDTGLWEYMERQQYYEHHHIQTTQENMNALAELSRQFNFFGAADHFHVYKGMNILLECWDRASDGCYVTADIAEDSIKAFCEAVGCRYGRSIINEDGSWDVVRM